MIYRAILGLCLALSVSVKAQMDLANWYTQTVKATDTWASFNTRIDSLDLALEINAGMVTTRATLVYAPSQGFTQTYSCDNPCSKDVDTLCSDACRYVMTPLAGTMDSLETTSSFQLADNSAVTDMSLWVGDVKVKAALQDRATASAQYEDIVKRRKDPALLETSGNGFYSLRIFPNESGRARKIEITIVQGMENSGNLYGTALPFVHGLQALIEPGTSYSETGPKKRIASIKLTAVAKDGKSYSLKWPGLGNGVVGATPLQLQAVNLEELQEGSLSGSAQACAGCLSAWTAGSAASSFFGVNANLDGKKLAFEPEPGERIVLLDVDQADSLAPERARKLALLTLKAYAQAPFSGNLAMPDGKGGLHYLFPASVEMTPANLLAAYESLKSWKPSAKADAKATLEAFAKDRGAASAGVVALLINNEEYPYYPYSMDKAATLSQSESLEFEKAQQKITESLIATLDGAHARLFGFWNNYRLTQAAEATGGFCLGGVYGWIYHSPAAASTDLARPAATVQPEGEWYLPPLYGPGRPGADRLDDLQVTSSGLGVEDLNVLQEYTYNTDYLILAKSPAQASRPLEKRASYPVEDSANPEITPVRISGRYRGFGRVVFTLTGYWGGLRFTQTLSADLPSATGSSALEGAVWAYQRTEMWGRDAAPDEVAPTQKLGKDFHVVTRQTSLLALEPGMDLWAEFPTKPGESGSEGKVAVSNDMSIAASGSNLDLVTLEEILSGKITGIQATRTTGAAHGDLAISKAAGSIRLAWTYPGTATTARFRILDLAGRLVAEIPATRMGNTFAAEWSAKGRTGTYVLTARAGKSVLTRKLAVHP